MMENKKSVLALMILVSLGVAIFVIYVAFKATSREGSIAQRNPQISRPISADKPIAYSTGKPSLGSLSAHEDFITPAIEAFSETISALYRDEAPNSLTNPPAQIPPVPFTASPPPSNPLVLPPPAVTITEKEVFEFGYNASYLKVLGDIKAEMIFGGFIASATIFPVTNMQEAIALQDKYSEYIENLTASAEGGGISKAEMDIFKRAYRELLPKLWERELRAQKYSSASNWPFRFFYKYQEIHAQNEIKTVEKSFNKTIFSFLISTASAQVSTSPGACYREGSPNLVRGSQRAAPCCNCGLFCSKGCKFVQDCGPGGGRCNVHFGCLNRACAHLPAIWDPATGICGCYI